MKHFQAHKIVASSGHLVLEVDEEVEEGGQDVDIAALEEGAALFMTLGQ